MLTGEREVAMSAWDDLKCRLGRHDYAAAEGDESGAHQTCTRCGAVRRVRQPPPDTQSHMPPM
ncbi:MAG TPA: hypothetical protein PLZ93_21855 [Nocardioides sp.]|nr:hypothetical protein [Nocardioides sp.]HRI98284.1 hypothetical protein [Nocardioides sp.]HRK47866.1 hypothetical protein [Nocardioides sp.]